LHSFLIPGYRRGQYLELKVKLENKNGQIVSQGEERTRCIGTSPDRRHLQRGSQTLGRTDEFSFKHEEVDSSSAGDHNRSGKRSYESRFVDFSALKTSAGSQDRSVLKARSQSKMAYLGPDRRSAPAFYERSPKSLKMAGDLQIGSSESICRLDARPPIEVKFSSTDITDESLEDQSDIHLRESSAGGSLSKSGAFEQSLKQNLWEGLPAAFCASQEARTR
jgi:hypothetical protein